MEPLFPHPPEAVLINVAAVTNQRERCVFRWLTALFTGVALVLINANVIYAAGASNGIEAKPGEIVLLRDVPHRQATRPGSPSNALLLDAGPEEQIGDAINNAGLVEINEQDAAQIHSGISAQPAGPTFSIPSSDKLSEGRSVNSVGVFGTASDVVMQGVGNIGRVTDGIGDQVGSVTGSLVNHIKTQ